MAYKLGSSTRHHSNRIIALRVQYYFPLNGSLYVHGLAWLTGADPGFFLGGGAPLRNGVTDWLSDETTFFFLQNTSCIRKPQVISGGGGEVSTPCTLPLDPPLLRRFVQLSYVARFRTREIKTKGAIYSIKNYALNFRKFLLTNGTAVSKISKKVPCEVYRPTFLENSYPEFPLQLTFLQESPEFFAFRKFNSFLNIWRTFLSTKNSENFGTDKNRKERFLRKFPEIRKLLNFQKANQSTDSAFRRFPQENQM